MEILFYLIAGLIWISWASARERKMPWFSWGTPAQSGRSAPPRRNFSRTGKPQSPWLQTVPISQKPKRHAQTKTRSSKRAGAAYPKDAFYRLNELTRNAAVAERLVAKVKEKNPTRDYRWCIEKAIYDIERDRMAR